jgi:hypothetical protein
VIRKFRSIEEMNAAQRLCPETDPERILQRAHQLYESAMEMVGTRRRFRGVHKFRSIEESNQFRLAWMRDRAQRGT